MYTRTLRRRRQFKQPDWLRELAVPCLTGEGESGVCRLGSGMTSLDGFGTEAAAAVPVAAAVWEGEVTERSDLSEFRRWDGSFCQRCLSTDVEYGEYMIGWADGYGRERPRDAPWEERWRGAARCCTFEPVDGDTSKELGSSKWKPGIDVNDGRGEPIDVVAELSLKHGMPWSIILVCASRPSL